MRLTVDCAVADDLADIVDPIGFPQDPAGVWRNKPVQVLHPAAISGNESVIVVAAGGREAHYGAAVVDRQAPGTRSAKRAQVYHLPVAEAEGVRGTVAPGVSLAGDLVLVVDRIRDAPTAAEGAERSHRAVLVDKAEKVARGVIRITCDDPEIIDAVCITGVTAERSEVGHLSVAVEKRVVLPAEMRRIADDLAGVIQGVGDTVIRAKRADVDHLAARVEEGAIRTSRNGGVTGDLPGGVDPARLAVFATECTDIDQLTIAVKKGRVAHLTRRRARFSRHLAAAIDAVGDAVTSTSVCA